ncbi:flavin-containing monooxygenase [Streptomyces sp. NPDC015346]|uniref:flavin-containing monooxygenase n=1 Tax=Streptomyces sp. NPDC015346 TaxID=3364954 RepID=UPI0036F9EE4D
MSEAAHPPARIAIIGAGVSGLCLALKLKAAHHDDFVVYEKAETIGGVWRDNSYPGLSCDIPSRTYCYSFAPNSEWTSYFSSGPEILRYLNDVADAHGVRSHLRVGEEVTTAAFHDGAWSLTTASGTVHRHDFLICATGVLVRPKVPDLPGLDTFEGAAFHSSRWDHSVDTAGRRIAVVGTGSTGVQITCALAGTAKHFFLFQRSPQWVFPKPNKAYTRLTKSAHRHLPAFTRLADGLWRRAFEKTISTAVVKRGWQRWVLAQGCRLALLQVRSPELRRRLTPDYPPLCKRLVAAAGFYRAVQRANVSVVCDSIERITPNGIVTKNGTACDVDIIVFATGFQADAYMRPMTITGLDGVTLDDAWADGPRGYQTVALPGFPNLFMLAGPNSPFSNESVMRTAETQADYIMKWIRLFNEGTVRWAAPTQEATDCFNAAVRRALPGTTFSAGCASWYQDTQGVPVVWPWSVRAHRSMLARVESDHFHIEPGPRSPRRPRPGDGPGPSTLPR